MKQKVTQLKITNKSLKAKAKEIKSKAASKLVHEEVVEESEGLGGLFGEEEPPVVVPEKKDPVETIKMINPNECRVIGYILLTKPASMNVMDPLTVGCLYFNGQTKTYSLRVKKLTFSINYLQNFISIDTDTGRLINKINGR